MGVLAIDRNGLVRYINRLLIRTDDLQDETVLGRKMVDFYPMERDRHISIHTLKTGESQIKKTIVYFTGKKNWSTPCVRHFQRNSPDLSFCYFLMQHLLRRILASLKGITFWIGIPTIIYHFIGILIFDIFTNLYFIQSNRIHLIASCPETMPLKFLFTLQYFSNMIIAL